MPIELSNSSFTPIELKRPSGRTDKRTYVRTYVSERDRSSDSFLQQQVCKSAWKGYTCQKFMKFQIYFYAFWIAEAIKINLKWEVTDEISKEYGKGSFHSTQTNNSSSSQRETIRKSASKHDTRECILVSGNCESSKHQVFTHSWKRSLKWLPFLAHSLKILIFCVQNRIHCCAIWPIIICCERHWTALACCLIEWCLHAMLGCQFLARSSNYAYRDQRRSFVPFKWAFQFRNRHSRFLLRTLHFKNLHCLTFSCINNRLHFISCCFRKKKRNYISAISFSDQ